MRDRLNRYTGFFRNLLGLVGFRKLPIKQDWMRLEAGDIAGCKVPYLVHYNYHRYFWNAADGNNKVKVMSHIILN